MSNPLPDSDAAWAALIIVVLPLLIIGSRELEERLRQRDSAYQPAIGTLRVWVVPLLTVWVLARSLLDIANNNIFIQLLGTAVILSGATAALAGFRVVVAGLADRLEVFEGEGERGREAGVFGQPPGKGIALPLVRDDDVDFLFSDQGEQLGKMAGGRIGGFPGPARDDRTGNG